MDPAPLNAAVSLAALRRHWPEGADFLAFGGGSLSLVATTFREIEPASAWRLPLGSGGRRAAAGAPPFGTGLMGILSYDQFTGRQGGAPARLFRVESALVVDHRTGRLWRTGDGLSRAGVDGWRGVDAVQRERVLAAAVAGVDADAAATPPLALTPLTTDAAYLATVERALEDIRSGRYYQINLLRYFRLAEAPDLAALTRRFAQLSGPFAAWVDVADLSLISFSPEAFVRVEPDANDGDGQGEGGATVETRPVKGTAARAETAAVDRARGEALLASAKDRAELAMIVDLMRNDLSRIAVSGSVRVPEPLRLMSVPTVHHLEARVTGRLQPDATLGGLLAAVCPGGSITGAPKREVMQAIRDYEGRERGYFMGHAFYCDDSGRFDSSILIRTLVRRGTATPGNPYEFAAGSGIVMRSEPEAERREIEAKARILTDPL